MLLNALSAQFYSWTNETYSVSIQSTRVHNLIEFTIKFNEITFAWFPKCWYNFSVSIIQVEYFVITVGHFGCWILINYIFGTVFIQTALVSLRFSINFSVNRTNFLIFKTHQFVWWKKCFCRVIKIASSKASRRFHTKLEIKMKNEFQSNPFNWNVI